MDREDSNRLLDRIGVVKHLCDLDLLVFFARHPRCLLSSESLAAFLGYEPKVVAESLDTLLAAGLVTRNQTSAHVARLYVLSTEDGPDGWLPSLMESASTRAGRLALRAAIARRAPREGRASAIKSPDSGKPGPRRVDDTPKSETDHGTQTG